MPKVTPLLVAFVEKPDPLGSARATPSVDSQAQSLTPYIPQQLPFYTEAAVEVWCLLTCSFC